MIENIYTSLPLIVIIPLAYTKGDKLIAILSTIGTILIAFGFGDIIGTNGNMFILLAIASFAAIVLIYRLIKKK